MNLCMAWVDEPDFSLNVLIALVIITAKTGWFGLGLGADCFLATFDSTGAEDMLTN